jgi:hypothetical protein
VCLEIDLKASNPASDENPTKIPSIDVDAPLRSTPSLCEGDNIGVVSTLGKYFVPLKICIFNDILGNASHGMAKREIAVRSLGSRVLHTECSCKAVVCV